MRYLLVASAGLVAMLILLEWRSRRWPRYRRMIFGMLAFFLNFMVLALISIAGVFAVIAGAHLLPAR